jgi:predicted kinase
MSSTPRVDRPTTITLPDPALILLVGASGSGKSTFARKHFRETEILSSDRFRALVSDDETDQSVTPAAFEVLHLTCSHRLVFGKMTVIDATNVQAEARRSLLALARRYHFIPIAIVFDLPEALCQERTQQRPSRPIAGHVIQHQVQQLHRSLDRLRNEGFKAIHYLASARAPARVATSEQET